MMNKKSNSHAVFHWFLRYLYEEFFNYNVSVMKKITILTCLFLASLLCSCEKNSIPGESPASQAQLDNLYKAYESLIDYYPPENRYKESLIINDWILDKVTIETYVDGILEETSEDDHWTKMAFSFRKNHRMSYSGSTGVWLYSHNLLMWVYDGCYYAYEVVGAKGNVLQLKEEIPWYGGYHPLFIVDKSGKHQFWIFEYRAK